MYKTEIRNGILIRKADDQPLRTKFVATIGTPKMYKEKGAVDLDGTIMNDIDYPKIIEGFFKNGVDIIRLNCSHVDPDDFKKDFLNIKKAILQCEKQSNGCPRMAVLADLPGPKIRFQIEEPIQIIVGEEFYIHFDEVDTEEDRGMHQTVYVDDKPLKREMDEQDTKCSITTTFADEKKATFEENVLGCVNDASADGRFKSFMNKIENLVSQHRAPQIFVGDGEVVMEITDPDPNEAMVTCTIISSEVPEISGKPGFTLKGIDLNIPTFNETDKKLLEALLEAEYDKSFEKTEDIKWEPVLAFIGLSFTQTAEDVMRARKFTEEWLCNPETPPEGPVEFDHDAARLESPAIVAKIETTKGWDNIDFILDVADGIMVARGDLGLQINVEEVPLIQKKLIELCNKRGKPVITATQMLTSMENSIEPTRAEGSDVFNAILDGTDAVMTSGETAKGKFPFHTVRKMSAIAVQAELHDEMHLMKKADPERRKNIIRQRLIDFLADDYQRIKVNKKRISDSANYIREHANNLKRDSSRKEEFKEEINALEWKTLLYEEKEVKAKKQETTNRITQAACTLTETSGCKAIVAASASGRTARMIARLRPPVLIIGAAHDLMNMRKLLVSRGVIPICISEVNPEDSTDEMYNKVDEARQEHQYLRTLIRHREKVIYTAGTPVRTPGTTNLVQIREIE